MKEKFQTHYPFLDMKIKLDFVTNSSSTTYIAILPDGFDEASFCQELGAVGDGPIADFVSYLTSDILKSATPYDEYVATVQENWALELPPRLQSKIDNSRERGLKVLVGSFSSDQNFVEIFYCVSSFEIETDQIYINLINSYW